MSSGNGPRAFSPLTALSTDREKHRGKQHLLAKNRLNLTHSLAWIHGLSVWLENRGPSGSAPRTRTLVVPASHATGVGHPSTQSDRDRLHGISAIRLSNLSAAHHGFSILPQPSRTHAYSCHVRSSMSSNIIAHMSFPHHRPHVLPHHRPHVHPHHHPHGRPHQSYRVRVASICVSEGSASFTLRL